MPDDRFVTVGPPDRVKIAGTIGVDGGCLHAHRPFLNTNSGEIHLAPFVMFGYGVSLLTGTHDYSKRDAGRFPFPREGHDIRIGRGVWIASGATIVGPCTIGDHAVIGAGSLLIASDVPAGELWAGNPARFIKRIEFTD